MFLLTELNTFYLKFVLWVPPEHWFNHVRLFILLLIGAVGLRETFQLLDDPDCDKLGRYYTKFIYSIHILDLSIE